MIWDVKASKRTREREKKKKKILFFQKKFYITEYYACVIYELRMNLARVRACARVNTGAYRRKRMP